MDYERCTNNWCSDVKNIFSELGFSQYFNSKYIIDLKMFEQAVRNHYCDIWRNSIMNAPKLRTYMTLKTEYELEQYVKLNLAKNERSVLAQFRCGILPIRVETGRYVGELLEERLCRFCDLQSVETECHFLINCPFYNDIRTNIFKNILQSPAFIQFDNATQLNYLMRNHPRNAAKYLTSAIFRRKQTIYAV